MRTEVNGKNIIQYLIGQNFGGHNFRRTKLSDGQNFRQQFRFSAVFFAEILSDKGNLFVGTCKTISSYSYGFNASHTTGVVVPSKTQTGFVA